MTIRTRDALINALIVAASSLITLIVLETVLGKAQWGSPIGRLPPGGYVIRTHEWAVRTTANRYGLRESGFAPETGTRRVLLIGDSFVEGTGQSDQETIAWLMNEHFSDKSYQVFNAGVSGANISDYAEVYRSISDRLSVRFSKVVIVLFLGNDFLDYGRLAELRPRRDQRLGVPDDPRWAVRTASTLLPNTFAAVRGARGAMRTGDTVPTVGSQYDALTHIEWFDANNQYFDRPRLTDAERARFEERFRRIPEASVDLIRRGMINKWCYHVYVTEALNDFIYNMDSPDNERIFASTVSQLDTLIRMIDQDVSVVLIPDKFQISERERTVARTIMGADAPDDEFRELFAVNARLADWIRTRHPDVQLYDATEDLVAGGGERYYFRIDGHMNPAGAELLARKIVNGIE